MKLSYLSNKGLLDDLWSSQQVSHKSRIFRCSKQLGAVDAAECFRWYPHNKRAQHEQRRRVFDLVGWKMMEAQHR